MKLLLIVILILQLYFLLAFFIRNNFSEKISFLPAIWYLIFFNLSNNSTTVSPVLFTNLFILFLLHLNVNYSAINIKNRVLLSGILIAISSFIDAASALLLVFIIASIIVNRFSKIKEIIITFIGFLIPYIYIVAYHLLSGNLPFFLDSYHQLGLFSLIKNGIPLDVYNILFLLLLVFILLYVIYVCKLHFDNKLIVLRKRLISLNSMVISIVLLLFFSNISYPILLFYLAIPFCFYFSIVNQIGKRLIFNEILFSLFIVSIIVLHSHL